MGFLPTRDMEDTLSFLPNLTQKLAADAFLAIRATSDIGRQGEIQHYRDTMANL